MSEQLRFVKRQVGKIGEFFPRPRKPRGRALGILRLHAEIDDLEIKTRVFIVQEESFLQFVERSRRVAALEQDFPVRAVGK